jgi:hypothetical protein
MSILSIDNVITVTLQSALKGLADVNTSVLALITQEVPISASYGDYGIYKSPGGVATDFGSNSDAYRIAQKVFGQTPNILSGGGYLVIIPRDASGVATAATILSASAVNLLALTASDYKIKAAVDVGSAAEIAIGELDLTSLEAAEVSLNSYALETAGLVFELSGSLASANVVLKSATTGAASAIVISACTTGTDIAVPFGMVGADVTGAAAGSLERIKDAILRVYETVPFFGIILDEQPTDAILTELAAMIQTMDKLLVVGSSDSADVEAIFTDLKDAGYMHTRCVYYSLSVDDAVDFAAAYAGRGFCINFTGSNTAHTMHLKDITGFVADTGMTQTLLTKCMNAGVDSYPNIGGIGKCFISGVNMFFDQIYTRLAFKLRLQIAGFNYLATTNTKIPQTEEGMSGLKGALRKVCAAFVRNGVFAPGTWNSSTTYGDPEDHIANIAAVGFYIYGDSIADQSQADRELRIAPSIYIAAKDAGAIHSSDVLVNVEA